VKGLRPRFGFWIWANAFSSLSLLGIVLALYVGPLFVFLPFPFGLVFLIIKSGFSFLLLPFGGGNFMID